MEFTIKLDTANEQDVKLLSIFGAAVTAVGMTLNEEKNVEQTCSESTGALKDAKEKNEETIGDPIPEGPAREPDPEALAPEKPKRTRRKKVEEPAPEPTPEPAEETKTEEPTGEMPFDAEVEEPAKTEETATEEKKDALEEISLAEWQDILHKKREELKLDDENSHLKTKFNAFVREKSLSYGAELPKNLTASQRYKFVFEVFMHISIGEDGNLELALPF